VPFYITFCIVCHLFLAIHNMAKKMKTKSNEDGQEEEVVAEKPSTERPLKKKKAKVALAEDAAAEDVADAGGKPEKKKKKKQQQQQQQQQPEEDAEMKGAGEEEQEEAAAAKADTQKEKGKKKKKKQGQAQEDDVEGAVPQEEESKEDGGKKRKKNSKEIAIAGEEDGEKRKAAKKAKQEQDLEAMVEDEDEEIPKKKKKSKEEKTNKNIEDDEDAAEAAPVEATKAAAKTKKNNKKKEATENEDAEEDKEQQEEDEEKEEDLPKADAGLKKKDALCTVFVGGIPWSMTEEELRSEFESCGDIYDLNMIINRDNGLPKGIAFVTFDNRVALNAALLLDGKVLGNRTLKVYEVDDYRPREGGGKGEGKGKSGPAEFEVFIKNINSHTEESELREHFVGCGEMESMTFPVRALGKNKGFAWIVFKAEDGLKAALDKNGSELKGFKLVVERARQGPAENSKGKGKGKGKAKGKGKGKGKGELEVFVSNLAYETTQEDLRGIFDKCGRIERLHMPSKGDKPCMGFAWLTFSEKRSMDTALDLHQETFGGRRIKVEKSGQHLNKPAEEE